MYCGAGPESGLKRQSISNDFMSKTKGITARDTCIVARAVATKIFSLNSCGLSKSADARVCQQKLQFLQLIHHFLYSNTDPARRIVELRYQTGQLAQMRH